MSRDLVFWRQKTGVVLDARAVYEALMDDADVDGLEEIDEDQLIRAVLQRFPAAERTPGATQVTWVDPSADRALDLWWSRTFFVAHCSWTMTNDELNALVDAGFELGCPLYDPQDDERFDSWADGH